MIAASLGQFGHLALPAAAEKAKAFSNPPTVHRSAATQPLPCPFCSPQAHGPHPPGPRPPVGMDSGQSGSSGGGQSGTARGRRVGSAASRRRAHGLVARGRRSIIKKFERAHAHTSPGARTHARTAGPLRGAAAPRANSSPPVKPAAVAAEPRLLLLGQLLALQLLRRQLADPAHSRAARPSAARRRSRRLRSASPGCRGPTPPRSCTAW